MIGITKVYGKDHLQKKTLITVCAIGMLLFCVYFMMYIPISLPVAYVHVPKHKRHTERYIRIDFVSIASNGDLMNRVMNLNSELGHLRRIIIVSRKDLSWLPSNLTDLDVIREQRSFHLKLNNITGVTGIGLVTKFNSDNSSTTLSNLIVKDYYKWVASEPLCTWIKTPKSLPHRYNISYNNTCTTNTSALIQPWQLSMELDDFLVYLHIVQDAFIDTMGTVVTRSKKLTPDTCRPDKTSLIRLKNNFMDIPLYEEVFVISQFWGVGYFHRLVEVMPRIATFVPFLQNHPNIRIHAPSLDVLSSHIFHFLGISPSRIITGQIRAEMAYIPRGSPCGKGGVVESQILALHMRNYTMTSLYPTKRNKVILIKRSGKRKLTVHDEVKNFTAAEARARGLQFVEWKDLPILPVEEAMRLFYEAVVVIAPHGAGLANLLFSQPGTYIIEIICNRKFVNLCYQRLSERLGLRYHAIPAQSGCEANITIRSRTINTIIETYLNQVLLINGLF